ncbi:Putative KHG/KDPG aldolase [Candidatus Thermoflexus japonica]|uniref:2-dehydro-3-deoxy-phosphogluconate aldolase n=1 Tax=Candidatus Thermoflexus japonica TaxID=2035417 RepID=A0A2H5YA19_9CHLR|nr:Putative KHG/KDPG aldolase [Candidatus Thermoflexus japonica]
MEVLEAMERAGAIPIAVLEDEEEARFFADAMRKAGLPVIEVTFRTAAAAEVIRYLRQVDPQLIIGAGTILTPAQAAQALQAGAQFIVSPGFDSELAAWCRSADVLLIPGVATPSEVMAALRHGLYTLKFFPAEAMGGTKTLEALAPVFPQVRFIPTGGIRLSNLADYLKLPNVIACGGTWLADRRLIRERRADALIHQAQEARALVEQIRTEIIA